MGIFPNTLTLWHNPGKTEASAKIFTNEGHKDFKVPPGEDRQLPSEYDRAIRREKGGVVVGGLAPNLVRKALIVDGKQVPVEDNPKMLPGLANTGESAAPITPIRLQQLEAQVAELRHAFVGQDRTMAELRLELAAKDAEIARLRGVSDITNPGKGAPTVASVQTEAEKVATQLKGPKPR